LITRSRQKQQRTNGSGIATIDHRTAECERSGNGVHGAGVHSNAMNRFMQKNVHEVLQKVDFST
jgi:hypothetical protein